MLRVLTTLWLIGPLPRCHADNRPIRVAPIARHSHCWAREGDRVATAAPASGLRRMKSEASILEEQGRLDEVLERHAADERRYRELDDYDGLARALVGRARILGYDRRQSTC